MDSSSKKYILLLILICILFAGIIFKAFDYLPDKSVELSPNINTQNKHPVFTATSVNERKNTLDNEEEKADVDKENHKSGHFDFTVKDKSNTIQTKQLEEINAPNGVEEELVSSETDTKSALTAEEQALKSIIAGKSYRLNSENEKAIDEFEKIVNLTDNKELLAMSYENLAEIYASQRRYGKAITYANKAYTNSPSSHIEMLIARIYYSSGDKETAISRLNALLKRNFN